jgi:outer membrane protein OmpA-like peptidoglycan-associated protein
MPRTAAEHSRLAHGRSPLARRRRGGLFRATSSTTQRSALDDAPDLMSPSSLLAMQRTLGNAYVSRLVAERNEAIRPRATSRIDREADPALLQRDSTDVHAELTGHASPRWEHTRGGTRSELNMRLSEDRVEAVRSFFEEMLGNALRERGLNADISYESRSVEEPAPVGSGDSASLSAGAVGNAETDREAGGNTRANAPSMRRVDVKVTVTWQVAGEALSSESEEVTIPEECEDNATDQWAIKLSLSGGGGHAGLGGAGALGVLKNRRTGQTAQGSFQGGGIGVGLSTPGADPGWGDYENFTTDSRVTFEDFDGTLARLTTAGAGIAIIGYGFAYISFPNLGANSISVGGFNMGALGADAGSNVGTWNVIGRPPGPVCTPEHTEHREWVNSEPYNTAMPNEFRTRVLFDTGSAEISDEELLKLQEFVDAVMANYEYSGVEETRLPD